MGARSGACVGRLGWMITLSIGSFASTKLLGRDIDCTSNAFSRRGVVGDGVLEQVASIGNAFCSDLCRFK
jgi:hypothetical protein